MSLGVDTLPDLTKDPGDRNRTSPFAFTGNRFEFRAVGSGQSVAGPLVALNTILADSIQWVADQIEDQLNTGNSLEQAAFAVLKRTMDDHGSVIFGGDGYSSAWHRMAVEERGLENLPTSADALPVLQRPAIRELFERQGVLSPLELESRYEVYAEQYVLAIEVEAKLVLRLARTQVYPVVMAYLDSLARSLKSQEALGIGADRSLVDQLVALNQQLVGQCTGLEQVLQNPPHGVEAHMAHCAHTLLPMMLRIREAVDGLELLVDDADWPLPSYQEMLFVR
jgi:glutamine synthetase